MSGSGSHGACAFPLCSGKYVGSISGVDSGVFVLTGSKSVVDVFPLVVFVPRRVECKCGQLIDFFWRTKS